MTAPAPDSLAPVRTLTQLYAEAESRLFADLARIARSGRDLPEGSAAKLDVLRRMRRAAQSVVLDLNAATGPAAQSVITAARTNGAAAAIVALKRTKAFTPELLAQVAKTVGGLSAFDALATQLTSSLGATHGRILRTAADAYQAAIGHSTPLQLAGVTTGREAENTAWNRLTARGVSGFTDAAGRSWNLASYAEMATRTSAGRAFNISHKQRMNDAGITYYRVSSDGRPCPLCAPYDGQILSDDTTGSVFAPHATHDDEMVQFEVVATLSEAQAAGFQHPNCRHTLGPYLPGISTISPLPTTAADERRSGEQVRLRDLERRVRVAKRQTTAALSPEDAKHYGGQVRALQAQIRDHVDSTGLNRRRYREQPNLGHR